MADLVVGGNFPTDSGVIGASTNGETDGAIRQTSADPPSIVTSNTSNDGISDGGDDADLEDVAVHDPIEDLIEPFHAERTVFHSSASDNHASQDEAQELGLEDDATSDKNSVLTLSDHVSELDQDEQGEAMQTYSNDLSFSDTSMGYGAQDDAIETDGNDPESEMKDIQISGEFLGRPTAAASSLSEKGKHSAPTNGQRNDRRE